MSDEQTPPPATLRLKPRLRPAESESPPVTPASAIPPSPPPPPAVVPAGEPPTADANAAPKIRFKPRLAAEPAGAAPAATPATPEPAAAAPAPAEVPATPAPVPVPPPEPPVAAATVATPPAPPPTEAGSAPPKIRLKVPAVAETATAPAARAPAPAPAPVVPPPAVPPPVVPAAEAPPAADAGKFKLKPKAPPGPPAAVAASAPPPVAPPVTPPAPPSAADGAPKVPPPFPVIAPPKSGKTNPPIPHIAVAAAIPDQEKPAAKPVGTKRRIPKVAVIGAAAVVVIAGGWFAWQQFATPPPPPAKAKAPVKAAPAAAAVAKSAAGPTPSDTLNALAKAPVNAINKAQDAVAARRAGDQNRVDLADGSADIANKPAVPATKAPAATKTTTGVTTLSPGVSATTEIEGAAEASPAFRSFVANAKIGGVFQSASGSVARVFMNGRMVRAGEIVDVGLGIVFDGVDAEKRNVVFKDKTGATVTRRY